MKIAIAQPTYLPWLGYFDLLDQVDRFVLLDNVQFEKQSWQQRNRIKTPAGLQWLTVPVVFRGRLGQHIADVEIREPDFWRDHLRAIELNYRRAPFFERYFGEVSEQIRSHAAHRNLSQFTTGLFHWLRNTIGIGTPVVQASNLRVEGKRTELLGDICRSLGANIYLSPLGSAEYLLNELTILTERGIEVTFQHYEHPEYKQLFPPFQPYASVLDLLFNEGDDALSVIRSGRRTPFLPGEVTTRPEEKVNS